MNNKYVILIILCLVCFNNFSFAQKKSEIDSLRAAYKNSSNPSKKLDLLQQLCGKTKYSDFETALIYGKKGIELAQQLKDVYKEAEIHNDLGLAYTYQSDFGKAFQELTLAENIFNELGDREMVGVVFNNLGLLYHNENNYGQELTYHHKALAIFEKLDLPSRKAMSYINMGRVFVSKKDYKTAGDYFVKAYHIYDQLDDKDRIVTCLNNIASIYLYAEDYKLANIYFDKNLELLETLENVDRNKAMVLYNSTGVLLKLNKFDLAEARLTEALILCKKINDKESLAICYHNFGELYLEKKMYKEAKYNYLQSLELCMETSFRELEIENYKNLAKVYENTREYEKAYKNYIHYAAIKDSIFNKQIESINEVEKKYLAEKSAREIEAVNIAKQEEEHQANIVKIISTALILVLFSIIFSVVLKYRDKKKSNLILEEKNKEITDSINYAERIQRSFLATTEMLDKYLGVTSSADKGGVSRRERNYFVFFRPKDIVSGDFYWAGKLKNGNFAVVNADSTGHGVPGAIMSILNISSIEKAIDQGLTEPAAIFNATRNTIIERLKKDGSEHGGKDGMDASIVCFDFENNKITYTAANNPVWIIRNSELIEIKPEKMPVGKHDNDTTLFTQGEFELQKGDLVYTLTDGFPDQFGGEKGKKFMSKNLKALLVSIAHLPMHEQEQKLSEVFTDWKSDLEQVDDVCLIGVRI